MRERIAVIDLGTNTFHLFIAEPDGCKVTTLYREKIAVKIGKNGISKGKIAPDAFKRAIHALSAFRTVINLFEVNTVKGVATSAIRSAKNGRELVQEIKEKTNINIEIISGNREAELIFEGVKAAMSMPAAPQLVVDIGGGSVEFIMAKGNDMLWCQSFEIGTQRLLDQFHRADPIPKESVTALHNFLSKELKPLAKTIKAHQPRGLIGCSGAFDTLKEIYLKQKELKQVQKSQTYPLPITHYRQIHRELLRKNREERLQIPGMVTLRADMIVVASCLIHHVLEQIGTSHITSCAYALKEGLLFSNLSPEVTEVIDRQASE